MMPEDAGDSPLQAADGDTRDKTKCHAGHDLIEIRGRPSNVAEGEVLGCDVCQAMCLT